MAAPVRWSPFCLTRGGANSGLPGTRRGLIAACHTSGTTGGEGKSGWDFRSLLKRVASVRFGIVAQDQREGSRFEPRRNEICFGLLNGDFLFNFGEAENATL